jgi:hypothetical protein
MLKEKEPIFVMVDGTEGRKFKSIVKLRGDTVTGLIKKWMGEYVRRKD